MAVPLSLFLTLLRVRTETGRHPPHEFRDIDPRRRRVEGQKMRGQVYKGATSDLVADGFALDRMRSIIDGVNACADKLARHWGEGRLRLLVAVELRTRFDRQARQWNEAVWSMRLDAIEAHGAAMVRAWQALDKAARDANEEPLRPEVWEVRASDGRVFALVRTLAELHHVAATKRYVDVYCLDEIARLLVAFPLVAAVKQSFPGAVIEDARAKLPATLNDELPL